MNPAAVLRVRSTRWLLLLTLCGLLPPSLARAQMPASTDTAALAAEEPLHGEPAAATDNSASPASAPRAARTGASRPPPEPRFAIDLQAPQSLRDFLLRHLELQRFRTLRDLDAPELSRLLAQAPDNLRDLLGTQGYFSPQIVVDLTAATAAPMPENSRPFLGTVILQVEPGPQTRIASAQVYFRGDIATAPEAASQREAIERSAAIVGDPFTQVAWDNAKSQAVRALTAQRYPGGRVYNSLADIDPLDHSARLYLELDSGPPVQVGAVRVEGIGRYDPAVVERLVRLAGLAPGTDYNLNNLQAAQQRLADTGYFDSVFVTMEPQASGEPAPVVVQVREGKQQKLVFGVGGSTDSGARLSLEHTHLRVPGIDWRALSQLRLERDDSLLSTLWSAPVDRAGWRWITSAQVARQVDGFDTTTSQRLRLGQSQEATQQDRSFFLQYDRARVKNSVLRIIKPETTDSAISANYAWTRRRFDSTPFPSSGHGLSVELGVGATLGQQQQPFVRSMARWLGYWPVGTGPISTTTPDAAALPAGRLALRLQGGVVWAKRDAPIPDTQLFLTGGDTTVRGYGLRNIGVPQADGGVSPGRYLAVGSVEWQRPVVRNGERTAWETVLFLDAGAVADQPSDLRARVGVGAGVRYNSPVGPIQADLAYGVTPKRLRLHLTVGFTF